MNTEKPTLVAKVETIHHPATVTWYRSESGDLLYSIETHECTEMKVVGFEEER